jgi:hypothetical protein
MRLLTPAADCPQMKLSDVVSALVDSGEWLTDDGTPDPIYAGLLRVTSDPGDFGVDSGLGVHRILELARAVDRAAGGALPVAGPMLRLIGVTVQNLTGRLDDLAGEYAQMQTELREQLTRVPPERLDLDLNY